MGLKADLEAVQKQVKVMVTKYGTHKKDLELVGLNIGACKLRYESKKKKLAQEVMTLRSHIAKVHNLPPNAPPSDYIKAITPVVQMCQKVAQEADSQ